MTRVSASQGDVVVIRVPKRALLAMGVAAAIAVIAGGGWMASRESSTEARYQRVCAAIWLDPHQYPYFDDSKLGRLLLTDRQPEPTSFLLSTCHYPSKGVVTPDCVAYPADDSTWRRQRIAPIYSLAGEGATCAYLPEPTPMTSRGPVIPPAARLS